MGVKLKIKVTYRMFILATFRKYSCFVGCFMQYILHESFYDMEAVKGNERKPQKLKFRTVIRLNLAPLNKVHIFLQLVPSIN